MPTKSTNEVNHGPAKRRTDKRLPQKQKIRIATGKRTVKRKTRVKTRRRRVFPIWLRILVISILCAAAAIAGLVIGYGIIGSGNPVDALRFDTWKHIFDLIESQN